MSDWFTVRDSKGRSVAEVVTRAYERGLTEGMAWQPIETAPKDGTRILVARIDDEVGVDEIEVTEWCVMENWRWELIEADTYRKVYSEPTEFWNGNGHRATHWMALPPAPRSAAGASAAPNGG